jgi:ABC-2 type transport system ATP-binding protein
VTSEPLTGTASATRSEPAIEVSAVVKNYDGVAVLGGVSLTVATGEFFGIVGPNGAGKTTLIEIMEGLRRADSGSVTVLGYDPTKRHPGLLRAIAVHTQAPAFFPAHTALEHLTAMAALYRVGTGRVADMLEQVGLTAKAGTRVDRLSGGQRQRLALASALVHDPRLLFLDEPTSALDTEARNTLLDLLRGLKTQGRTVVYTTHQLTEAQSLCDRVAILSKGSVIALDSPEALIRAAGSATRVVVPAHRLAVARARAIDGVDTVTTEGLSTVITTRAPGRVLEAVAAIAGLDEVETSKGTLEDVYLQLTGSENT